MNLSFKKQQYLQAIGIENWQLRQQHLEMQSISTLCLMVKFEKNGVSWLLLAQASPEKNCRDKEARLLTAICQAMGVIQVNVENYELNTSNIQTEIFKDFNHLIFLGSELTQNEPFFKKNSKKYFPIKIALSQLLEQPVLKANLWMELQPLCQLIA